MYKATLTHEERRIRRKQIAEDCKTKSMSEVARSYRVSVSQVINACNEYEVVPVREKPKHEGGTKPPRKVAVAIPTSFLILKLLLDGEKPSSVARKFNVTKQYVDQVKQRGIGAGFPLKNR